MSRTSPANMARAWLNMFLIVCATREAARTALELVLAGRTSYRDGSLSATAAEAGCSAIVMEDRAGGAMPGGVREVNPFSPAGLSPAADRLLRPS